MAAKKKKRVAKKKASRKKSARKKTPGRKGRNPKGQVPPELAATTFKPGTSGNPNGRPPRVSFEALCSEILDELVPGTETNRRELVARVFIDAALARDSRYLKELIDREWPKPTRLELTGPAGGPVEVLTGDYADLLMMKILEAQRSERVVDIDLPAGS